MEMQGLQILKNLEKENKVWILTNYLTEDLYKAEKLVCFDIKIGSME